MTRLLIYMLPGIILDIVIFLLNTFYVSDITLYNSLYGTLCPFIQILAIVIPCVIYYIKMPPGKDTRP